MNRPFVKDNRGLTLIELMVGVVILAVIIVPLLHTFVTGAKTEYKTHYYGEATNAAQNLSEQIQAQDADFLLTNSAAIATNAQFYTKSGTSFSVYHADPTNPGDPGTKAPEISGLHEPYYIGIQNYSYGDTSFDALITLTAPDDSTADNPANSKDVVIGNQMDALLNMTLADKNALDKLKAECGDIIGTSTDEALYKLLNRSISFNVAKTVDSTTDTYKVEVLFNYTASIEYTDAKGKSLRYDFYCTETSSASIASVVDKTDGSPFFSVFMFYDAYYKNSAIDETILINNKDNDAAGPDVNFFIVNTNTSTFFYGYSETFWYKYQNFKTDPVSNSSEPVNSLIFTNLPSSKVTYYAWREDVYRRTVPTTGYLVETKTLDRKFNVNVKLFAPVTNDTSRFTGTPVAEIDSTKTNY